MTEFSTSTLSMEDSSRTPQVGMGGWIELPTQICSFFRRGTCLRVGCNYFHGTEQQLHDLQSKGAVLYRTNDGSVYIPSRDGEDGAEHPAVTTEGEQDIVCPTIQTRNEMTNGPLTPQLGMFPVAISSPPSLDIASSQESSKRQSTPGHSALHLESPPPSDLTKRNSSQEKLEVKFSSNSTSASVTFGDRHVVACLSYLSGSCQRSDCRFVHLKPEIRLLPTCVCAYHNDSGGCKKSASCRYFHGTAEELRQMKEKGTVMYNPQTNQPYETVPDELEDPEVRRSRMQMREAHQANNTRHGSMSNQQLSLQQQQLQLQQQQPVYAMPMAAPMTFAAPMPMNTFGMPMMNVMGMGQPQYYAVQSQPSMTMTMMAPQMMLQPSYPPMQGMSANMVVAGAAGGQLTWVPQQTAYLAPQQTTTAYVPVTFQL